MGAVIYPTTGKVSEIIDEIPGEEGWGWTQARNDYFRAAERMIESGIESEEVFMLLNSCYWAALRDSEGGG